MLRIFGFLVVVLSLAVNSAQAVVTIETVTVGNPGNGNYISFGSVPYTYKIGKYEVTNTQYCEFLNAVADTDVNGLYSTSMATSARGGITRTGASGSYNYTVKSGYANKPVVFVNWYDALRFCNWLSNGQPTGQQTNDTTEAGVYTLTGAASVQEPLLDHGSLSDGKWFLPTENEWYKAAYHKNDGVTANYWHYPTASDADPLSDRPPGMFDNESANYFKTDFNSSTAYNSGYAVTGVVDYYDTVNYLTDVGAYRYSPSAYGTFDQGGNASEWDETMVSSNWRGVRGGSWYSLDAYALSSSTRNGNIPGNHDDQMGFRVAGLVVPEPSSLLTLLLGVIGVFAWKRRKGTA